MDIVDFTNDMHHIVNNYDEDGKYHTKHERMAHAIKALALVNELTAASTRIATLESQVAAFNDALDPDKTKHAYIGEFRFNFPAFHGDGEEISYTLNVPWRTIKEIMATIKRRAIAGGNNG